jgi:hypothetical protein
MSRHHKGAYMDLLMAQVNNGHMSLKQIKNLLGKEDENLWEEILKDKFIQDPEGKFFNQKVEDQVNKKRAYSQSRLKNLSSHKDTHMGGHMEEEEEERDIDNKKKREELQKEREGREEKFRALVYSFSSTFPNNMLIEFSDYWTEPNKSGTKMRFEGEKTWDLGRRLARWAANNKQYPKPETEPQMRSLTYQELINKFNAQGAAVYDIYKPVQFPDKDKPLWVHVDDIKKFNLQILKK